MSLLFMDGFDHYVTADITKKWPTVTAGVSIVAAGIFGGNCMTFTSDTASANRLLSSNSTTLIAGGHWYVGGTNASGVGYGFLIVKDTDQTQVFLQRTAAGAIVVRNGVNTLLGTSADGVMPGGGVWSFVELKATIDNATGSFVVKVNGAEVLNVTGVDTQISANASANKVQISQASNTGTGYVDNLYVCDTLGSSNNDFLGEVRVKTVMPTAEGTNTGWTPLSGTDNALMVDETSQDGDTTYNYTDTTNARDTYVIGDIASLGGAVYGVAVNVMARKEGDVIRKIKSTLKSGATYALGTEVTLGVAYTCSQDIHNTNPDGSVAWTETTVNAIEAGVDLTV